jgi:ABC-type nitrate/sulfonate/bicarbonate transport system substrate-binding protein
VRIEKLTRWVAAILASAAVSGPFVSDAQAADKIITGFVGSPTSSVWPYFIGMSKGYFAEAGIELDPVFVQSAPNTVQQISAGSLDLVAATGLTDPLYAIDKGAPIAVARVIGLANPYALASKPEIKSFKDLKGKTIVIGGLKDITRVYFDRMMIGNGLKEGDYDITVIGATPGRFSALRSGAVDAALLIPPLLFQAEHAGFTNLGLAYDYTKDLPFGGMIVNRNWASSHLDVMKRLMPAYAKSLAWFEDDKNRDESIAILRKAGNLEEKEVAEAYAFSRKIPFFERTGKVSKALLGNLMKVLMSMGELQAPIPMEKVALRGVTEIVD